MKPSRFTEEQIIGILKQAQAGMKIAGLCRMHGGMVTVRKKHLTQKTVKCSSITFTVPKLSPYNLISTLPNRSNLD
jgi:hypothetical protein